MTTGEPLDLSRLRVYPLSQRQSLTRVEDILVEPNGPPPAIGDAVAEQIRACATAIREARRRGADVLLVYGAHLLRNGAAPLIERLLRDGWVTHLATNGAGTIHDWEFAYCGSSSECVRRNVARGCFGTWDETATHIHLAIMTGALDGLGYGRSLGRFIHEDQVELPSLQQLREAIASAPDDALTAGVGPS